MKKRLMINLSGEVEFHSHHFASRIRDFRFNGTI